MDSSEAATTSAETVAVEPVVEKTALADSRQIGVKLAPYNPTNIDAVHIALDMLALESSDVFYDLGCGDGRLLIEVTFFSVDNLYRLCCVMLITAGS